MTEDIARRLFREQIRRELLDEFGKYRVGFIIDSEMLVTKGSDMSDGILFLIPKGEYLELLGESK